MNKVKIGLTCTPSKIIDIATELIFKIKVSCGGGMGGSSWYEYAKSMSQNKDFFEFTLHNDEVKTIGKNFIVSMQEKNMVTVVRDETAHINYREHKCTKCISTTKYCIGINDKVEQVNAYIAQRNTKSLEEISTETDRT